MRLAWSRFAVVLVLISALGLAACGAPKEVGADRNAVPAESTASSPTTTAPTTTAPTTTAPPTTAPPTTAAPFASETLSQTNARRTADDYLDYSAFSPSGLIEQLEFEGYSNGDAAYAVDALGVDWNEQAAKMANDYLDYSAFARSGLIEQLEFEGFTPEQAEYGVSTTGL